jgi:hypothetical protein
MSRLILLLLYPVIAFNLLWLTPAISGQRQLQIGLRIFLIATSLAAIVVALLSSTSN